MLPANLAIPSVQLTLFCIEKLYNCEFFIVTTLFCSDNRKQFFRHSMHGIFCILSVRENDHKVLVVFILLLHVFFGRTPTTVHPIESAETG